MKTKTKRLLALALSATIALSSAAFAALAEGVATPPEASAQPTPGEEQGEIQEGEQDVAIEVTDPVELPVIPTQEPDETAEPEEPEDPEETGAPDEMAQPEETAQPEPSEEPAQETPAYESAYAYVAAGTILYADPQRTTKLGTLAAEAALRAKNVGEYAHGSVYEVFFDTYKTAGTGRWETAYFYTSNIRRLTEAQTNALTSERIVNGAKVLYAEFTYYVEPEADEGEDVEPVETTEPAESAEPEETEEPAESAEPEETEEPAESAEPEETAEPAESAEPEETAEPAESEEPEETAEPAESAEPEETTEPEESAEPEEEDLVFNPEKTAEPAQSAEPAEIEKEPKETPQPEKTEASAKDEEDNVFVPREEEKISTLEDELDPNRRIDIYAHWEGEELYYGDEATLYAALTGYDNVSCTLQWQSSVDNATWMDIPGATGERYTLTVSEENYQNYWRVMVKVSDVK